MRDSVQKDHLDIEQLVSHISAPRGEYRILRVDSQEKLASCAWSMRQESNRRVVFFVVEGFFAWLLPKAAVAS